MKFRIAEYLQGDSNGNRFVIEKGTPYRNAFYFPKTAWEVMKDEDNKILSYKTMDEAVLTVKELQSMLPIYHIIK